MFYNNYFHCYILLGARRRSEGGFNGSEVILRQLAVKPDKRRVGLVSEGPPARTGTGILDIDENPIGVITSGGPSPMVSKNIAIAYVPKRFSKVGMQLKLQVRNKTVNARVVKMPFVPSRYFTKQ